MTAFTVRYFKLVFAAIPILVVSCARGTTDELASSANGMGGAGTGGAGGSDSMVTGSTTSSGGAACVMDTECLSGQWCNAGVCDNCNTDARCGTACAPCAAPTSHCKDMGQTSVCLECLVDMDCGPGATCVNGVCNNPCLMAAKTYDFESGDQEFTHAPTSTAPGDDPWQRGQVSGTIQCHGGMNCFATNLSSAGYSDCQTAALVSPAIDLSKCMGASKVVTLSFWHYYKFEPKSSGRWYDGGTLQFSADNGTTWMDITTNQPYQGVIDGAYGLCSPDPVIGGHMGWSGTVPGAAWVQVSTDLDASYFVPEFKFRFLFGADGGTTNRGWLIDDITITPH